MFSRAQCNYEILVTVAFLQLFGISNVVTEENIASLAYKKFPKLIIDMTTPINAKLSNTISEVDFNKTINSHRIYATNGPENGPSLLYDTECAITDTGNCTEEILNVTNALNTTFGMVNLIVSFALDTETAIMLTKNYTGPKIEMPDYTIDILVNLNNYYTSCDDLKELKIDVLDMEQVIKNWISPKLNTKFGLGYAERLTDCSYSSLGIPVVSADFVVLNMRFGYSEGVTESFGLFERRMKHLHKENIKYIKNRVGYFKEKGITPIYFPNADSVGDEGHRRLLLNFAEKMWGQNNTGNMESSSMIIQAPFFEEEALGPFFVIAYVEGLGCGDSSGLRWHAPSAFSAISKYFDTFLLSVGEWRKLNAQDSQNGSTYVTEMNTILQFFGPASTTCLQNLTEIEMELEIARANPSSYLLPNTFVFPLVDDYYTGELQFDIDLEFIFRISPNHTVGCWYDIMYRVNAAQLVNACQVIGGNSYILRQLLYLDPPQIREIDYLYYEYNVRGVLEDVDNIRQRIIRLHPNSSVYFHLIVISSWESKVNQDFHSTMFCNPGVLEVNLYYEAILNWAKFRSFPIILKTAFDDVNAPSVKSWMSMLRPLTSPRISVQRPFFVLRNYPPGINNWSVDPCLELGQEPSKITSDYFYTLHIGTIFHVEAMHPMQFEAYEIMLQYILHRFHLVEIVIRNNNVEFLQAVANLQTRKLIDGNKKLFVCYQKSEIDQDIGESLLSPISEFIPKINPHTSFIKGIHFELSNVSNIIDFNSIGNLDTIKTTLNGEIDLGISTYITTCMELIDQSYYPSPKTNRTVYSIFTKVNYMVCNDELNLNMQSGEHYLGGLFDTHLYIKKAFQDLKPGSKVYFSVNLKVELYSNQTTMEPYLKVLSYFRKFGENYNMSYFIVNAFDNELAENKNGWWGITDFGTLADPSTYFEKESVYSNQVMWRPTVQPKTITKTSPAVTIVASVTSILLILFVGISAYFFLRYKKVGQYLSDKDVHEFIVGFQQITDFPEKDKSFMELAKTLKFNSEHELSIADLNIDRQAVLGTGNFGTVYKGIAKGRAAAVKTPNKHCSKETFMSILSEVKVLSYIGFHVNVVEFLGAYTKEIRDGILYIVTELCSNGSLENFLRMKTNVISKQVGICSSKGSKTGEENCIDFYDLHRFAREIASGMEYIAGMRVIHGDLSTRNVFLDEKLTCKIGDFGLSRKLYEYQKCVKNPQDAIPWKWMAYESLTKLEFTTKSDMWSFGVVLWEIYSLGCTPYAGLNWGIDFTDKLRDGLRLQKPTHATNEIYDKMMDTWKLDPAERPVFAEMLEFFKPFCYSEYSVVGFTT